MDLDRFMKQVGASDAVVAKAVRRDPSTISRIRRRRVSPDAQTLLMLNRWADGVARELGLDLAKRLSWDHLLAEPAA